MINSKFKTSPFKVEKGETFFDNFSLKAVAEQLRLPIAQVQQIAFRLIVVNLFEELPMVAMSAQPDQTVVNNDSFSSSGNGLSQEFLQSLMGFLQAKT